MNTFNIKRTNIVGLCAAVLAFIFSFLPFYKAELGGFARSFASDSESTESIILIKYNIFGALLFLLFIVLIVLFLIEAFGKSNATLSAIITALTIASLVLLLLTIIVGNKDIKEAKEVLNQGSAYMSILGMDSEDIAVFKVGIGYVLELIVVLILAASYWINEFVIKTQVYHFQFKPEVNPFKTFIYSKPSFGAANAQYGHVNQQFNPQANQQFNPQANQQFNPQAGQQFNSQANQQFNSQAGQPQNNNQNFNGFNN